MKKKILCALLIASIALTSAFASGTSEDQKVNADGNKVYPDGTVVIYGYGQPQYLQQYFDVWLENNRDIAPNVDIEIVQTQGAADTREKVAMTYLSGAYDDLPDAIYIDPVNLIDLAEGNIIKDETNFLTPLLKDLVDGCENDGKVGSKLYGLPESVRPQVLFYNKAIFDKYDVDPEMMSTMEGYIKAGELLKERSNGDVYLSYIDPGSRTWRYYGRRGLMPQANARIWDEDGNIVFGSDEGTKLALKTLDEMNQKGLLLKTSIFKPALYDSMRNHEVATFYIGAFWDEFIRKNVPETSGEWRVMSSPVFESVGTAGAPVSSYFAVIDKPEGEYAGLVEKLWHDFHFDNEARKTWVKSMVEQNAPYANPINLAMLEDPFWKEASEFYGGQSFRQMEGQGLANSSKNLVVTKSDAEADSIISNELENYVAGNQTMAQTIEKIDANLKNKIGKAAVI
ncbi:MAG: ABC transporter substrate-binding protein [Pleomorphochaeta sp.]